MPLLPWLMVLSFSAVIVTQRCAAPVLHPLLFCFDRNSSIRKVVLAMELLSTYYYDTFR
jgi:hypothetical protein